MIFTEQFHLSTLICDEDDQLTLWGLARLFQHIAGRQSDLLGAGFKSLQPDHKAWVLTRVYYQVDRYPFAGEQLTLRTWPRKDNGLVAPRDYELVDADGHICAVSSSNWVILDMDKRRVCRLGEIMNLYEIEDRLSTPFATLSKMVLPEPLRKAPSADVPVADQPGLSVRHIDVPHSAIDHTRHVNNAEYIKWIVDSIDEVCLPRGNGRPEVREFDITYQHETRHRDPAVFLMSLPHEGRRHFAIHNSTGLAVAAAVTLSV